MVRGIRDKSPCDAEERKKYYARRAKNNESARKHRDRTREKAEGFDKFKEINEKLKAELEQKKRRIEELEKENLMFRNLFLTPENIQSSLQRSHCGACRNTRADHHPNAPAVANYPQFAPSRIENTSYNLPEPHHVSAQLINGYDSSSAAHNLKNITSTQFPVSSPTGRETAKGPSTYYVIDAQQPAYYQHPVNRHCDINKEHDMLTYTNLTGNQSAKGNALEHYFTPSISEVKTTEPAKYLAYSLDQPLDSFQSMHSGSLNKNLSNDQLISALQALMASQATSSPVNSDLRHLNSPQTFGSPPILDVSPCFRSVPSY